MNQTLKITVYGKGTLDQLNFLSDLGGMTEEEKEMLKLLHYNKSDISIMNEMNISQKTFNRIEESMRAKLTIAIFTCINKTYDSIVNK